MTRNPAPVLSLPNPVPDLGAERLAGFGASRWQEWTQGFQSLRQRWACLNLNCTERSGLRAWCKLPSRIQLQQGWCCSPECFETAFQRLAAGILHEPAPGPMRPHRIPIGLTLLSRGLIDQSQLKLALEAHNARGGHGGGAAMGAADVSAGAVARLAAGPVVDAANAAGGAADATAAFRRAAAQALCRLHPGGRIQRARGAFGDLLVQDRELHRNRLRPGCGIRADAR